MNLGKYIMENKWIQLAPYRVKRRTSVATVKKVCVPYKEEM